MNIYQRINAIRQLVDYAKKDKAVEGYKAVTHDQITAITRQHFIAHGVVIVPSEIQSQTVPTGTTTSKGTPFIRFESKYSIDFVNMDDPADKASVILTAHALDHGDKAPGKALSYAVKSAILKLLNIETGEDDESRYDQTPDKKKKITPSAGAWDKLSPDQQASYLDGANEVIKLVSVGKLKEAIARFDDFLAFDDPNNEDPDKRVALWSQLPSTVRTAIKKYSTENKTGRV